jgi:hypothetical protein
MRGDGVNKLADVKGQIPNAKKAIKHAILLSKTVIKHQA